MFTIYLALSVSVLAWFPKGKIVFMVAIYDSVHVSPRRSQWRRRLRHEPSSPAQTLGSWVRIPLEAWMSVSVYSVCR
jgi:hypothetical protein